MENIFSSWRKKSSKFSKSRKSRKSRFFLKFWKKLNILTFWKFSEFWDFWKFRKFLRFLKNLEKLKCFDRKNFQPKKCRFFFDNLFRSQISPRFQKSHLENRVMSSKMWKSDFLRFWYTFTWPQGSDLAKIRLFDLWISKYSEKFQKNLKKSRKKIQKKNSIETIFFLRRILSPDFWYFFTMNLKIRLNPKSYELVISVLWQLSYGTWTVLPWNLLRSLCCVAPASQ